MHDWLIEHQIQLSQQILAKKLPHAILFSGVKGVGKNQISQWLIDVLLCQKSSFDETHRILQACGHCKSCLLMKSGNFPDHVKLSPEKNSLGVDAVRHASQFFEKTPQIGEVKTVMITDAQLLTVAAANALLKTLEEPSSNRYIILSTNDADIMLPTILSRCRLMNIRPPTGRVLLKQFTSVAEQDKDFINLSQLPELENPDLFAQYQTLTASVARFLLNPHDRLDLLQVLINSPHTMRWLEKIVVNLYRSAYNWLNQEKHQGTPTKEALWDVYQEIVHANKNIISLPQANSQFILEKLLTDIAQIINRHEQGVNCARHSH